jgi:limonene-1,2-epoxide hydrolase
VNGAHLGDERIALGHVADQRADLFGFVGNVEAEDVRSAGRRLMKSEQRVNERGFAGAVGTEQTDCFATQVAAQVLQDLPATKRNAEAMQVDYGRLDESRLSCDRFLGTEAGSAILFL